MTNAHGVARDQLRAFIERIERLEEEKKTIADDIKDVYGEAKSMGFDSKILRKVISIRKQDADERAEQEAILDTYLHALGMIQLDIFEEPETSPKLVATVATAMQTQAGRAALLTAVDIMIEREERFDAETGEILDDHTETATASQDEAVVPSAVSVNPLSRSGSDGANAGGEDVKSSAQRASVANVASGPDEKQRATNSPEQANEVPAQDGEGTGLGESLSGKSDAAHPVSEQELAETVLNDGIAAGQTAVEVVTVVSTESGTVSQFTKPKYVLRPNCRNPEACGGYSDKHCHACTLAMRKREQAEEVA
ncbi:DUF2312 domain-containing protein [Sinorhizobium meliloti]|uniref:DUF2312 domain-containing protein n=1 Tax=Rhizobium meliloti TaxID=382 RepID=UPI003F139C32